LAYGGLGALYFTGIAVVALLLAYEHAIVRPDDLTRMNVAFFQVNILISMGLLAVGLADLLI
jgi:4-hydroxybenzoate polyprenyltransferase